jgi:IMP dehydrogenase
MLEETLREGLTFDDVTLVPAESDVLPAEADLRVRIAGLELWLPMISSAMDTVTEAPMAAALARLGGLGVIHRNLTVEAQAREVERVKEAPIDRARHATPAVDAHERLLVAAAIGVGADRLARAEALLRAGADALCIDTAHGHSRRVLDAVSDARARWPSVPILAGNVSTGEGCRALCEAGAHAVKVGQGPGSICTTRVVAGVGVPQVTAIAEGAAAAARFGVTVIGDGGVRYSGDLVKALAAGAHAVMLGGALAGTDESPGDIVRVGDRAFKTYRGMGSLGAMQGGAAGAERYSQDARAQKFVPEGVEGCVPYKGPVEGVVFQLAGGLRAGMGYLGCRTIEELRARARFMRVTPAGLRESHAHDVLVTNEAPNYRRA